MRTKPLIFSNDGLAYIAPALVWALAWGLMLMAYDRISLGNLALLLVLANAVASLWLRPLASLLVSSVAVGLFNWSFVPPRFTLTVDLSEDAVLLVTTLAVSTVISYLMELKRQAADHASTHQMQARMAQEHVQNQQLRNTLLTSISHDYRTPLTTVMSSASVIAEQAGRMPTERIGQLAEVILDEAQQLRRMTNNTLQLARLDSNTMDIPLNWESVEEIVGTVGARARRTHPQRRIEVRLAENLPLLRCDAVLINQLLDNLIENSLRHSAVDKPILIQAQQHGTALSITVEDQGCGIADAWKERVFDIFQRVEASDVPADGQTRRGIGIGLAVCRAIAEVHGGQLQITDKQGGGTTVRLTLPLSEQPEQPRELSE
ncbi:MAG: PAS domain-containing sensor histidine kinase [Betaproteobacteria bacterium]|nr:PAS domain-containing sensor histidine kinase [Betaproteobacteria bacterium]